MIVSVIHLKGGSGKTTTAMALATWRAIVCSKVKDLRSGAEAKASLKRALSCINGPETG